MSCLFCQIGNGRDFVHDHVLNRDDQFFVRQCCATEAVVKQALRHFTASVLSLSRLLAQYVAGCVYIIYERRQYISKVFRIFVSVPFADVDDQRCIL